MKGDVEFWTVVGVIDGGCLCVVGEPLEAVAGSWAEGLGYEQRRWIGLTCCT